MNLNYIFNLTIRQLFAYVCVKMNKIKKPELSKEKLGRNPFVSQLKIEVNRVTFEGQYKKDKDGVWLPVSKDLEVTKSCKLYLTKELRLSMFSLTPRAKELLLWLIYESESNCEWIWVNKVRYMKESGVASVNTYKAAVTELIRMSYLQISVVKDTYWINPDCFFNGNRVNVFQNNVVKKQIIC